MGLIFKYSVVGFSFMAFDYRDYHEGNLGFERFLEILRDIDPKLDENDYNLEKLHSLTLQSALKNPVKEIKYNKKEKANKTGFILSEGELKETNNKLFSIAVKIAIVDTLQQHYHTLINREKQSAEYSERIDRLLREKSEQRKHAIIAAQILIDHQKLINEAQQREALQNYVQEAQNKLNLLKAQREQLLQERAMLIAERESFLKEQSKNVAATLSDIKNSDGVAVFDCYNQNEKEQFSRLAIESIHKHRTEASDKNKKLDEEDSKLEQEISELDVKIKESRSEAKFEKGLGNVVAISHLGIKSSDSLVKKRDEKVNRRQEIAREKELNNLAADNSISIDFKEIAHQVSPDSTEIFDSISPEELAEKFESLESTQAALKGLVEFDNSINDNTKELENVRQATLDIEAENSELIQTLSSNQDIDPNILMELEDDLGDFLNDLEDDLDLSVTSAAPASKM